jgi:hypothetical protein
MSKSVSVNQEAALSNSARRTAYCLKIDKPNGERIGFTDVNKEITIDVGDGDGPLLYIPKAGFDRSAFENSADFSANSAVFKITLSTFGISREDIRRHRLVGSIAKTFMVVDYDDLTQGVVRLSSSKIGKTKITSMVEGSVEMLGLLHGFVRLNLIHLYGHPPQAPQQ